MKLLHQAFRPKSHSLLSPVSGDVSRFGSQLQDVLLSRLETGDGVRRQLAVQVLLDLDAPPPSGTTLLLAPRPAVVAFQNCQVPGVVTNSSLFC